MIYSNMIYYWRMERWSAFPVDFVGLLFNLKTTFGLLIVVINRGMWNLGFSFSRSSC